MWAPLLGLWQSAYRAELAALLLVSYHKSPLHVGIDNKGVVDKACILIQKAKQQRREGATAIAKKKPLKKAFSLQTDGDLWQRFWEVINSRGPDSIAVSEVKGHSTDQMVE